MDSNETVIPAMNDDSESYLDKRSEETICRAYKGFILEHSMPEIIGILLEDEENMHYCIVTDCTALLKVDMTLSDLLFLHSDKALTVLDLTLASVCDEVYRTHPLKLQMSPKPNLHARIKNIPVIPELWRERVPKSRDIGKFLAVEGTVIRTSSVKLLEYEKELVCSKCNSTFRWKAEFQQHYRITAPSRCPIRQSCNSKKFIMAPNEGGTSNRKCKDFQEIKIQEQMRRLAMGTIPRTITVVLEDDLVDGCKAGDDVVIYGALKCRWQPLSVGKPCALELVLKANYIEVRNEQRLGASVKEEMQNDFECFWAAHADTPMTARNHILASLCPQIYGLYVVKVAVALILAGGVPRTDTSGSRVRGEAHLLLVGDPGTGKSQFLKYASKITPRSVLTTGIGSTSAGLTVTAIRDGPHWTLEAGALVLADGGICCIDEFSSIKEHDRGAIHEAMEQQTVSVAKAGLVCKLNTRTSVLAATNPKLGKYDETASIDLNVAIASPLLSRFDIVLVLLDVRNELWDSVVADYVLTGKDVSNNNLGKQKLWSMEQMQAYFCVIKQINPVLSPAANRILSEYYRCHRRSDFRNAARTTIRLLESLIRIAEAHARLMYRKTVEVSDAVAAVTIMESSMQGASLLPTGSILHSCFPNDPEKEYETHAKLVLNRLGLDDIMKDETISTPKHTNLNEGVRFVPPKSPFESKVPLLPNETPSTSKQPDTQRKSSTPRVHSTSKVTDNFSFENFEKSIRLRNIFDKSQRGDGMAKTSTQNPAPDNRINSDTLSDFSFNNIFDQTKQIDENDMSVEKSPPKKVAKVASVTKSLPQTDFRSRLQQFRHITPDSSPEKDIPLSGMIRRGNRKINLKNTTYATSRLPNIMPERDEQPQFQTSTQSSSISVDFGNEISSILARSPKKTTSLRTTGQATCAEKKSIFSIDCSFDFGNDILQQLRIPAAQPMMSKKSIFTLNASAVEEICDELAFNDDARGFQNNVTAGQRNLPFVRNEGCAKVDQLAHKSKENKENAAPVQETVNASKLFRIEEDLDDWGTSGFFDFSTN